MNLCNARIASTCPSVFTVALADLSVCFPPKDRRGEQLELKWPDDKRVILYYKMPLSEIIFDFFDKLKQLSSGYATLDYEDAGYEESDLVKMTCLVNGDPVDPLSVICHRSKVQTVGKNLVGKLKDVIPRQMFEVRLQAAVR
jgi:translation elongation factor EF-4